MPLFLLRPICNWELEADDSQNFCIKAKKRTWGLDNGPSAVFFTLFHEQLKNTSPLSAARTCLYLCWPLQLFTVAAKVGGGGICQLPYGSPSDTVISDYSYFTDNLHHLEIEHIKEMSLKNLGHIDNWSLLNPVCSIFRLSIEIASRRYDIHVMCLTSERS